MIAKNRHRGTWNLQVDAFITPSEHTRNKFIEAGFPGNRILVKSNLVEDPGNPYYAPSACKTIVYAGRLSPEKGLDTLLTGWGSARLDQMGQLLLVGDGPMAPALRQQVQSQGLSNVVFTGRVDRAEV